MADDPRGSPPSDFRGRLLLLRGRAGLSQREVAALTGTSERAIQTWEAGLSFPSADRLKALIAPHRQRGVVAPGRGQEGVVAFWEAAREEAPRLNVPFGPVWSAPLGAGASAAPPPAELPAAHEPVSSPRRVLATARGQ